MESSLLPALTNQDFSPSRGWSRILFCFCPDTTFQPFVSFHRRCVWIGERMTYQVPRLSQITGRSQHQAYPRSTLMCRCYIACIRLMRAGDIESNPGPNDEHSDSIRLEGMFLDLCRKIPPAYYYSLGNSLGLRHSELLHVEERRRLDNQKMLMDILCTWKDRQSPGTDIVGVLSQKLRESELDSLADEITSGSSISASSLSKEQVQQCKNDLVEFYRIRYSEVTVDPLDFSTSVDFDGIYTNLSLIDEIDSKQKTPITYEDLLTKEVKGSLAKRILIQGEGGVGKTTLCKKIAWDWCQGRILQDLEMVLVIPLRDVRGGGTISRIAKSYLSDSNSSTSSQIDNFILENPAKVLLMFDGYDEFNGTVTKDSSSDVIRILRLDRYKSCRVIVTTRPWKTNEFTMDKVLKKAYTFVNVEGFNKENLTDYIKKYFHFKERDDLAGELISFMEDNDTIRSSMAPFPIFAAMLCLMWNGVDEHKRKIVQKLQTFSQLFEEIISFLKEHYASKMTTNFQHQDPCQFTKKADSSIRAIGKIALDGLLAKALSFPEERFSKCREDMEICKSVGILTEERSVCGRERRRDVNTTSFVGSTVSFPHKLFQEYIAGVYIHTLYEENRASYESLKNNLLSRSEELRYLLYFASAAGKDVGLSIIDGLINRPDTHFCIDVAFECHTKEAAMAVWEGLPRLTLTRKLSQHTVSAIAFMVHCNKEIGAFNLSTRQRNPLSLIQGRDLAKWVCPMPQLSYFEVDDYKLLDEFFSTAAELAESCQIKILRLSSEFPLCKEDVISPMGRYLAKWLCTMPQLSRVEVNTYKLPEFFYSTAVELAASCQVQEFMFRAEYRLGYNRASSPNELRGLAKWVCTMPRLFRFDVNCYKLPEEFLSTAVELAKSCQIRTVSLFLSEQDSISPKEGRGLAKWVCTMPQLSCFEVYNCKLPDEFFSTAVELSKSCQVIRIELGRNGCISPTEGKGLAEWVCTMPQLSRFEVKDFMLPDEFFTTAVELAESCQIQTLSMSVAFDHHENNCISPTEGRGLAKWVCTMPRLSRFEVKGFVLPDEFLSTAVELAESCQIKTLSLSTDFTPRSNDFISPTEGRGLAKWVCTLPQLSRLEVKDYKLPDEFFSTAVELAESCQIQTYSLSTNYLEDFISPTEGRGLAEWVCSLPLLSRLEVENYKLSHEFFSTAVELAKSCQIQTFSLSNCFHAHDYDGIVQIEEKGLANWVSVMPQLSGFEVEDSKSPDKLFSTAAELAESCQIKILNPATDTFFDDYDLISPAEEGGMAKRIKHGNIPPGYYVHKHNYVSPTEGRGLAKWMCTMPQLSRLEVEDCKLPDEFFSTAAELAESCRIEFLSFSTDSLSDEYDHISPTDGRRLAKWNGSFRFPTCNLLSPDNGRDLAKLVCTLPHLSVFQVKDYDLSDVFFSTAAELAESCQVKHLSFPTAFHLHKSDPVSPTKGRGLAKWVCKVPQLSQFKVKGTLPEEFFSAAAELAESCQIQRLSLSPGFPPHKHDSISPTEGRGLAKWVCTMPQLSRFEVKRKLPEEFFSTAVELAESCQIKGLSLCPGLPICNDHYISRTEGRGLAKWVCTMPQLSRLKLERKLADEFFSTVAELVESCQITDFSLSTGKYLRDDEYISQTEGGSFYKSILKQVIDCKRWISEPAAENLAYCLSRFPHLARADLRCDDLPRIFFTRIGSQTTSCRLEDIKVNDEPLDMLLSAEQQDLAEHTDTDSDSDSWCPYKRRCKTGLNSGQGSS
ncbi:uncharacterized protein [Diadema antillarum]|uniref:uncharacterized protein isoform X2 n=1 Tax=Diadema antillarum TaxID=105358 RepID=UPI003A8B9FA9